MKFEKTEVFNFKGALRGMRNPLNSWNKSDSYEDLNWVDENTYAEEMIIGPNDLDLAQRLIKAGPEHRKFLRQIFICVDITAPLYWWKEFDTYKLGTVANSTSTMHKLASSPITLDCFETEDFWGEMDFGDIPIKMNEGIQNLLSSMEWLRVKYLETKDKRYWKELVRWLPNGWLQKRTVTLSYENILNIYFQRRNHKLTEWHSFCDWAKTLPFFEELILVLDNERE